MSSIRTLFASRAKDFELGVKHFQDAKVSVTQIFKLFKDFIFCAKECIQINDEDQDDINVIFEIIYKYLNCILDYVGVGSITAKLPYLTTVCHEIYRAICDLQLTHEFVKKLSMPIFQVLLEPEVQTWTAKEILKMFSVIVQLIDRSVRSTLIEENFIYYIARFMDMLPFVDFEFQAIILEVLFRLYTQDEIKNKKNVFFFNTEQQRKAFYSIDTNKFDFSIRLYLNVVNEIENNIKSVLCYKVCMDECVLHAPEELSSFKGLWVDFNIKVKSISFYIGIHEYIENRKKDETMWEIVTIYAGNISSADISIMYNREKEIQEAIGIIKLKGPCIMVRQVPQKLIKTTTITMYSTNVQKMKNIFSNDIPKMTNRKIKGSFVPLNRRGYKPLDIISIKSSVTNHSSVLNHTINTDIVCNNSTKYKSSVKKSKRSNCTKDKIKEKITKTNSYGESFMSQLIDIPPETNDKNLKQWYSYGEAFITNEEVVSRNKMIKTDKSSCGYGEKFLSSLIDIDELFKDHDISPEGMVYDAETNKVVVRADKKLHTVCSEPKSIVLRSHVRNDENLSQNLNEKKVNKTKVTNKSRINNNNPKQQIRKKTLKENKKQCDQSSSHNSEVKKSEIIRRVNVSETHCSPELFASQMEFSSTQKNIYKSVSDDKIIFLDVIQTSDHLGSLDSIRDNCYIDPFDALKLEIPNRNLLLEENPKVDSTIEEQIPFIINEPEFELLRKPSNSDSVHIVPISSISNIEPPDYFPDDYCKIDAFDALKLEIPNLKSEGEKHPKVHTTIEEPIPIRMTETITEPLSIPANSSSDDTIEGDLKNSSLSFNNKATPNSDQDNCKIDPFNKMKLKMPNCKLQKGENPELKSNNRISNLNLEATEDTKDASNTKKPISIEVAVRENVISQDTEFFETAKMYVNCDDQLTTKLHPGESLELFNDISKNIDLSVAASSKNTDTEPHLPPESKTRIRILANIKIQSAFAKLSMSNIHTSNEYEKSEVCGLGSQDKIQDSENIQIVPEGDVAYNGPARSQEIECVQPDPDLEINMCNVSKTGAINVHDHSKNNLQKISCHNEDYVTDIKIKKPLDETLDNVKNTSTTLGICKRRKLYNPDFPELMTFTKESISFHHQESKAVSSCLKPEKELEENSKTLTKIEGKKKSVERKQTKTQLEKVYLSENKRKNNKRSTNFKRLDEEFQEVLRLLKSGDYLKKRPPGRPKNDSKKKRDLFTLDFSEFNADLERRGILKTKTNIKGEDNDLEEENNSRGNDLVKKVDFEGDDREIEDFLKAFGRFCGKLSSGQLKTPKTSTKKKLIAVCNTLLDIC